MKEKKDAVSAETEVKEKKKRKGKEQSEPIETADETLRPAPTQNDKYKYIIHNKKVKRGYNRRLLIIILLIFLLLTILFGGAAFGVLSLIEYNNFRIMIDRAGNNLLTLSHDDRFEGGGAQVISLNGPRYMDNITFLDILPKLPDIEGHMGNYNTEEDNYIAATFFLKNIGNVKQSYTESIYIADATKGVDEAIRIYIAKNGESTVYAKAKADGTAEEVVPGQKLYKEERDTEPWTTQTFFDEKYVLYQNGLQLEADEVVMYTIIIWLEGWDDQCLNQILGGTIRIEMQFTAQGE